MASKIDPTQINASFPVANINQSTQGFRDNFSAIQKNFSTTKSEIGVLQSTSITVSGDIVNVGTSPVLNQPVSLSIPLNVSLKSLYQANQTIDTSENNVVITVDTKGRISSLTSTPKTSYTGNKNPDFVITKNPEDGTYPTDTGIKSITAPIFVIDEYGNITDTKNSVIDGFGLLGYNMAKGSLLAGNNLNLSSYTDPAPTDGKTYYLVTDTTKETGLSWATVDIPTGIITNIDGGSYIKITQGSNGPVVNLDLSTVASKTIDQNTKILSENSDNSLSSFLVSDILNLITNESYLKTVQDDTSPTLGGDLNANGFNITSDKDLAINSTSSNGLTLQNGSNSSISIGTSININTTQSLNVNPNVINITSTQTNITSGNTSIQFPDSSGNFVLTNDKDISISSTTGIVKLNGISYPKSAPSNDKSYLAVNKDGTTSYITLTDALKLTSTNGVGITSNSDGSTNIGLDYSNMTLATSVTKNKTSIVVYDNTYLKTQLVSLSTLVNNGMAIGFVSPEGDDVDGDGSFLNPYQTIQKAINSSNNNIVLFPGIYNENLTISKSNIRIYSDTELSSTIIGSITISDSITGLYFSGINFQYATNASIPYVFNTFTTTNDVIFNRCILKGSQNTTLMKFTGALTQYVYFLQCGITGIIENNFTSGNVIIDEQYDTDIDLRIINSSTSSTIIRNITKLLSVNHISGNVIIENIDMIYDAYNTTAVTDSSGNVITINSESITSTSNNSSDLLYLNDCNLFNYNTGYYSNINKTGTSEYALQDVNRDTSKDILTGTALIYDMLTTRYNFIKEIDISTATYSLDLSSRVYNLKTSVNTTITVGKPSTVYTGNNLDYKIKVKLIGQGTGTFTFDSSVFTTKGYNLTFDGTTGQTDILELIWEPEKSSWYCVNKYNLDIEDSTGPVTSDISNAIANDPTTNTDNTLNSILKNMYRKRVRAKQQPTQDGQSAYTFTYDNADMVDVYLNGLMLDFTAYTCSGGNTITIDSAISANLTTSDVLIFILN